MIALEEPGHRLCVSLLVIFVVTVEEHINLEHRILVLSNHVCVHYSCSFCNLTTEGTRVDGLLKF